MNKLLSAIAVIILMMSLTSARAQNPMDNDAMTIHSEGKILAVRINGLQSRVDKIRARLGEKLATYQVVNDQDGKIIAAMQSMVEIDLRLVERELDSEEISDEILADLDEKLNEAAEIVEEI